MSGWICELCGYMNSPTDPSNVCARYPECKGTVLHPLSDRFYGRWRMADEDKWLNQEHGGTTLRGRMPDESLQCYGCGVVESEWRESSLYMAVMLPFKHAENGSEINVFLCDACWDDVAIETGAPLASIWDWLPEPQAVKP